MTARDSQEFLFIGETHQTELGAAMMVGGSNRAGTGCDSSTGPAGANEDVIPQKEADIR